MVFSSLTFLYYFLPIVMLLYILTPRKFRNLLMFLTGLFFYAWGEPIYVIIMILSTAIDFTAGLFMSKYDNSPKNRKIALIVSVVMNLLLLAVFKYSSFFITNFNNIFNTSFSDPKLPLPIGISFYTFQSMSYTIDLYMRNIKVQKNFISFASYVTLFPQIVAGPIVRYDDVAKELEHRKVNIYKISEGVGKFIKGLAKKVLIANNIGMVWDTVKAMDYTEMSVATAWLGILAFTFQIYFDFSGYSDMAVGLGKMLGFNFPKNFDYPYMSKSIGEFWRRWHITLGTWFKSYVYIPLGGNRKGTAKTIINLLIVWGLTGLWHGASWNFVAWGLYFGILIIIERVGFGKILQKIPPIFSMLYTFLMVVFGWVLFDTNTLSDAFDYFKAMFGATSVLSDSTSGYIFAMNFVLILIAIFASTNFFTALVERYSKKNTKALRYTTIVVSLLVFFLCNAYLIDATYNPFLYFRF